MRDGTVDFETGVVSSAIGPEVRAQALFRDRFVGVVRKKHSFSRGRMSPKRYASGQHIHISRDGLEMGPIDEALKLLGLEREIVAIVGGFSTAVALARSSDLIATVPERHTEGVRVGMHSFELPFSVRQFTVSLLWHPRFEADAAHRWLRNRVRDVCGGGSP
jgi:DNA-binding transcriptional LysR family regulator